MNFDTMFSLTEESDSADGVPRPEFDVSYPEASPSFSVDMRSELESEVYEKTPARHRYLTAKGDRAVVYFDKRGRAVSADVSGLTDGELYYVASMLGIKPREGDVSRLGSEDPADHGYITPVTEDLNEMGIDAATFISGSRKHAEQLEESRPGKAGIERQAKALLSTSKKPSMGGSYLDMVKKDIQHVIAGNGDPTVMRSYRGWTTADYSALIQALEGKPVKIEIDPNDPFEGPSPDMAKVRKFASMVQAGVDDALADMNKKIPGYSRSENGGLVVIKKRRKFIAIDIGGSGKWLVGPNGYVWGIKGYGQVHKGQMIGQIDSLIRGGFSFRLGSSVVRVTPGMHESTDAYIAEFDGVPWDNHLVEKQHMGSSFSAADSGRYQTSLKRTYVDMSAYPMDQMNDAAKLSAQNKAVRDIALTLMGRSDGVVYVRDPGGVLDMESPFVSNIEAAMSREFSLQHSNFDTAPSDFTMSVEKVNGKTGKGYRVKMKTPYPKMLERLVRTRTRVHESVQLDESNEQWVYGQLRATMDLNEREAREAIELSKAAGSWEEFKSKAADSSLKRLSPGNLRRAFKLVRAGMR